MLYHIARIEQQASHFGFKPLVLNKVTCLLRTIPSVSEEWIEDWMAQNDFAKWLWMALQK